MGRSCCRYPRRSDDHLGRYEEGFVLNCSVGLSIGYKGICSLSDKMPEGAQDQIHTIGTIRLAH